MFEQILLLALQYSALCGAVMILMHVVGTNAYDLSVLKRRLTTGTVTIRPEKHQRRITVLIRTHNNENTIEECLNNLFNGLQQPIEIVIIDDRSYDNTRQMVTQYKDNHPSEHITLIAKRNRTSKQRQLAEAYKKYGSGEFILTIEGNNVVNGQTIAVVYGLMDLDPALVVIKPRIVIQTDYFLSSLFQKYRSMLSVKGKKLASVTNSDYEVADVAFYRQDEFTRIFQPYKRSLSYCLPSIRSGNKMFRYQYHSDITIVSLPHRSLMNFYLGAYRDQVERTQSLLSNMRLLFSRSKDYSRFFTWFRLPITAALGIASVLLPIILTYFIYMSFRLHEPLYLLLSLAAFSMVLLYAVWGDDSIGLRQKLYYSLGIPLSFLAYYGLAIIQSLAIVLGLLQTGAQYL